MNRNLRRLLYGAALAFCVMCTACTSVYQRMIDDGYPPDYARGFDDGHQSGMRAGGDLFSGFRKNVDGTGRYDEGWNDGYHLGQSSFENTMKNLNY